MKPKDYFLFSAIVFFVVFAVHGMRVLYGWEAMLGTWQIPMWVSWVALIVGAILAYSGFKLGGYIGKK